MGTMHDITELVALSDIEKGAIKHYLIKCHKDVEQVRFRFEQAYGKRISAQVIKSILVKNEQEIQELVDIWHKHPENEEFFSLSSRLEKWRHLYDLALRPDQTIINTKLDKDKWGVEKREDVKTAGAMLKNAAWDVHTWQGLKDARERNNSDAGVAGGNLDKDDKPVISNWEKRA